MRVLITGSRGWPWPEGVGRELTFLRMKARADGDSAFTVVHGDAAGVDTMGRNWVRWNGDLWTMEEPHPADWKTHGKAAGFIRNQAMVDGGADICLAFRLNESRGTTDCMNRAKKAGIPVTVYDLKVMQWT